MLDWFRGRRPWGQLQRYVDALPAHSRYVAALLDDPDVVEDLALRPQRPPGPPPLAGFDPMQGLMLQLIDAVNMVTVATIASQGGKPPQFEPMLRPETELDRARNRVRLAAREHLAAMMTGLIPMDLDALGGG